MNLIQANNFEIVKIDSIMPFNTGTKKGHLIVKGFGILDKRNDSFVSIGSESPIDGSPVPTVYPKKSTVEFAIGKGLYEGFNHVSKSLLK